MSERRFSQEDGPEDRYGIDRGVAARRGTSRGVGPRSGEHDPRVRGGHRGRRRRGRVRRADDRGRCRRRHARSRRLAHHGRVRPGPRPAPDRDQAAPHRDRRRRGDGGSHARRGARLPVGPRGGRRGDQEHPGEPDFDGSRELAVEATLRALDAIGFTGLALVSSFNPLSIARSRELSPDVPTGLLTTEDVEARVALGFAHGQGHGWVLPFTASVLAAGPSLGKRRTRWACDWARGSPTTRSWPSS